MYLLFTPATIALFAIGYIQLRDQFSSGSADQA
jgi:hypothetical protein